MPIYPREPNHPSTRRCNLGLKGRRDRACNQYCWFIHWRVNKWECLLSFIGQYLLLLWAWVCWTMKFKSKQKHVSRKCTCTQEQHFVIYDCFFTEKYKCLADKNVNEKKEDCLWYSDWKDEAAVCIFKSCHVHLFNLLLQTVVDNVVFCMSPSEHINK